MIKVENSHAHANFFIKLTGIKKPTFFQRIKNRRVLYKELPGGEKLYSIKDWNKECPDYPIDFSALQ